MLGQKRRGKRDGVVEIGGPRVGLVHKTDYLAGTGHLLRAGQDLVVVWVLYPLKPPVSCSSSLRQFWGYYLSTLLSDQPSIDSVLPFPNFQDESSRFNCSTGSTHIRITGGHCKGRNRS